MAELMQQISQPALTNEASITEILLQCIRSQLLATW